MAVDVPMPKLGLTMEEAMILQWLVADGAEVETDQPIVLIETDKTETEVGSPGTGRLRQIGQVGEVFPCGQLIGYLLADGEAPPEAVAPVATVSAAAPVAAAAVASPSAPVTPTSGRMFASPNARRVASERGVPLQAVRGTGPGGRIVSEDVLAAPVAAGLSASGGGSLAIAPQPFAVASIAARNLADLLGIDLAQVPIDPIEQRVTRDSVALHVRRLLQQLAPPPTSSPASASTAALLQEPVETIRMSGMRGTIAKRMHASLQEMAQLTLTMDADMTAVLADRAERSAGGKAPTITDYVVAATARALVRHPRLNAQVADGAIAVLPDVHIGLAVAVDNGLLVPVVRDAAHLTLAALAGETSRLATAARDGSIGPADLEGGTFSVSALGAFGVDAFTPVINPPNAGILGVGRLRDVLSLVDGAVTSAKHLTLSLTWDHRVVDGVPAAEFCRTIVALLGDPAQLA